MTDATTPRQPSALELRIQEDLKQAMRDKNDVARDTLRMLKAELLREQVKVDDPNDAQTSVDEMAILLRAVKTRRESATEYERGGRAELAAKELAEVEVLSVYLPKPMDDDEAREALRALSAELGLTEKKQMSQLMKAALERHRGTLDGKQASRLLAQILS
ncbi:MAG: GatB/YqeY domain-containing protein [Polyangiales bacterium]|nr:GatB/YqeY domain-containing protein [Myxococcales bacterium]MCB9660382.1 GatB/YqeY domain-containing protein [Sandaracinaceae bacterium]